MRAFARVGMVLQVHSLDRQQHEAGNEAKYQRGEQRGVCPEEHAGNPASPVTSEVEVDCHPKNLPM